MSATISFYLQQNINGTVQVLTGTWVRLTNNSTAATFVSTTASDSNGLITVNSVPAGTYIVATGPTNTGAWTNTGDNNFTVNETDGSNNTSIPGPLLLNSQANPVIVGGTVSTAFRNNANNANNALITDVGLWTLRNGLLIPRDATNNVIAPNSAYSTIPIKIDDQLLSGTAASITFAPNPLPTTFRHLFIEWYARGDTAATATGVYMRFNNISTNTYDYQLVRGSAAATSASETFTQAQAQVGDMPAGTATANYFGMGSVQVAHYQGTTGNKLAIGNCVLGISDAASSMFSEQYLAKWRTTATAITRIDLLTSAGNFVAGSIFTLWGIP